MISELRGNTRTEKPRIRDERAKTGQVELIKHGSVGKTHKLLLKMLNYPCPTLQASGFSGDGGVRRTR